MKKFLSLLFLISCSENETTYLDYAASSHINAVALCEFLRVSKLDGNSSGINPHSKALSDIEKKSAAIIANKIGATAEQIVFTNNVTMANNIAILGAARKYPKSHLITTKIEHKSVLNVFKHLEKNGHNVTYLNVDRYGNVDLKQLESSIRSDTALISIQMMNSEIGILQNIHKIGEIAKKHKVLFHSDISQAFCKYDIDVQKINIDMMTFSGYKIGSPKGIAALWVKDKSKILPIFFGSGDELFPGTKPTALIAAFAAAVKNFIFDKSKIESNFGLLTSELQKIDNVFINSSVPTHIVSVSIAGVLLADILDRIKDYSFSAGCSCLGHGQSNVIQAIDPEDKLPACTLRISFSDTTNPDELISFARKLKVVVGQLRKEKSVGKGCEKQIGHESGYFNNLNYK